MQASEARLLAQDGEAAAVSYACLTALHPRVLDTQASEARLLAQDGEAAAVGLEQRGAGHWRGQLHLAEERQALLQLPVAQAVRQDGRLLHRCGARTWSAQPYETLSLRLRRPSVRMAVNSTAAAHTHKSAQLHDTLTLKLRRPSARMAACSQLHSTHKSAQPRDTLTR